MGKSHKIQQIVKLSQKLKQWRRKSSSTQLFPTGGYIGVEESVRERERVPMDVPPGHVAVVVGSVRRRFVVPATYLNHPAFRALLVLTEEEYGQDGHEDGPLVIPCDETVFLEAVRVVDRSRSGFGRFLRIGKKCGDDRAKDEEDVAQRRPLAFQTAAA